MSDDKPLPSVKQTTQGTIQIHDIHLTVTGPSRDELPEDSRLIGSDELMVRVEALLAELKADVESDTDE